MRLKRKNPVLSDKEQQEGGMEMIPKDGGNLVYTFFLEERSANVEGH